MEMARLEVKASPRVLPCSTIDWNDASVQSLLALRDAFAPRICKNPFWSATRFCQCNVGAEARRAPVCLEPHGRIRFVAAAVLPFISGHFAMQIVRSCCQPGKLSETADMRPLISYAQLQRSQSLPYVLTVI